MLTLVVDPIVRRSLAVDYDCGPDEIDRLEATVTAMRTLFPEQADEPAKHFGRPTLFRLRCHPGDVAGRLGELDSKLLITGIPVNRHAPFLGNTNVAQGDA